MREQFVTVAAQQHGKCWLWMIHNLARATETRWGTKKNVAEKFDENACCGRRVFSRVSGSVFWGGKGGRGLCLQNLRIFLGGRGVEKVPLILVTGLKCSFCEGVRVLSQAFPKDDTP